MSDRIRDILRSKLFLVSAGIVSAYLLFSYFAVDPLARRLLPWVAENKLASHASVEHVRFDPLRFVITVDNLQLKRTDDQPLAGFEHLYVDLKPSGVFNFCWRIKDIRLTAPQVTLEVLADGKLNWDELIAKLNEDKEKSKTLPRLKIDHILIEQGQMYYADLSRSTPFTTNLQPLGLELEGLSTLPEDRGDYQIAANFAEQGGTLKWKGTIELNPIASAGSLDLSGVKLAKLLQVIPPQYMKAQVTGGELQTTFSYQFAMVKGSPDPKPQTRLNNIALSLNDIKGNLPAVNGNEFGLQQLSVKLPELNFSMLQGTQLQLQKMDVALKDMTLNLGNSAMFKLPQAQVDNVGFDLAAHQLKVADIQLKDTAIVQDGAPIFKLPQAQVNDVGFDLTSNSLKVAQVSLTDGALQAKRNFDGSLDWLKLIPPTSPGQKDEAAPTKAEAGKPLAFDIAAVSLKHWQAAYQDRTFKQPLNVDVQNINMGFSVSNADGDIALKQLDSQLGPMVVKTALSPQPAATFKKISLSGGEITVKDHSASLKSVIASGLQTQVLRGTNKALNWQAMLEPASLPRAKPGKARGSESATQSNWKVMLNRLALEDGAVHIEDQSTSSPVALDIQNASAEMRDATLNLAKPVAVKARFGVKQGGQFEANGKLALAPLQGAFQLKLSGLSLKPFAPYVNQVALLKLDDGSFSSSGQLALNAYKDLSTKFQGGFDVENLAVTEESGGATFLAWKTVASDSLHLTLNPNLLHMDELRVVQPVGKIIIYEDKTMNIKRIMRAQPETAPVVAPAAAPAAANAAASAPTSEFPVAVEHVKIDNAELDFADLSLVPQFGTHINSLTGVINGLSTDTSTTAQVEMDGKVDEYGSARIRGSLQPFHATDFTDLKLTFRNLEMNRLTPYSGKFAGRRIDSGKMSIDLEYNIKNRQLSGENKFVINQLKLGEHVDSPDAVNLPLDLAIALLEDSDGVIDLDLPVTGNLDDPQFSYGKVIWKAIVNVMGKIVTAPFRALGHLLGISSDKLEAVDFDPGSAILLPPEQEKLKAISQALAKRPSLVLTIVPAYDAAADRKALQELSVRRDVAKEMGLNLKEGEKPGPIDLHNPKAQDAILTLVDENSPEAKKRKLLDKYLDKVKDYFTSKPSDPAAYDAMIKQLQQWTDVPDSELKELAEARADAMQQNLVKVGNLNAARLSKGTLEQVNSDGHQVHLRMTLGTAK